MDRRFVAVLIFAFLMATLTSTALYRLTANRPARAALPTEKLVFASHDLEPGTVLREGDLVLRIGWGKSLSVPPNTRKTLSAGA